MSRQVDLDIVFFRARNRIILRNGLFVCSAAREKRFYHSLCVRVHSDTISITQRTYAKGFPEFFPELTYN